MLHFWCFTLLSRGSTFSPKFGRNHECMQQCVRGSNCLLIGASNVRKAKDMRVFAILRQIPKAWRKARFVVRQLVSFILSSSKRCDRVHVNKSKVLRYGWFTRSLRMGEFHKFVIPVSGDTGGSFGVRLHEHTGTDLGQSQGQLS